MKKTVKLVINGETHILEVEHRRTLLEVIRDDLRLTGTKKMCGQGECGSCTVLMDGLAVNACLVLALDADGKKIETIEGLAQGGALHPIQEAFIEKGAIQCGFCAPGMIMTTKSLLAKNPTPTEVEIKTAIAGNFCRCTGYARIVDAIQSAAVRLRGE
ncbi:MAG TPA: (2Fe-2S)-binding protein [Desulfobaccales bacterium]|nr:(2Fe-2S)-binding protein [Desulfobaccales bacterium]